LRMLDKQDNIALFWTRDAATLPTYDRGAPFRMILNWWMGARGRQFVHAGAVGTAKGSVLLAGKSGSGKSTTATLCLEAGMYYLSDDYCLIAAESPPRVYSLYNSVKLEPTHLQRTAPALEPWISNREELADEKALIFLNQHQPKKITRFMPIRAILLPRLTGRADTVLRPATPVDALMALAPSTIVQLAGIGQAELATMSQFIQKVPSYHLALGREMVRIPQVILQFLAEDE